MPLVQVDYWFTDVLNQYKTRYMFCCKCSNSIYGESQTYSPSMRKTCDEVSKGDLRL